MEMILAKIQVRYRLNDDLFIDKGIIPYNRHKFVRSLDELGFSSKQIMLMRSLLASGILAAVIA